LSIITFLAFATKHLLFTLTSKKKKKKKTLSSEWTVASSQLNGERTGHVTCVAKGVKVTHIRSRAPLLTSTSSSSSTSTLDEVNTKTAEAEGAGDVGIVVVVDEQAETGDNDALNNTLDGQDDMVEEASCEEDNAEKIEKKENAGDDNSVELDSVAAVPTEAAEMTETETQTEADQKGDADATCDQEAVDSVVDASDESACVTVMCVAGGFNADGKRLLSTEWYDTKSQTWITGASLTAARDNIGVASLPAESNSLYTVGGSTTQKTTTDAFDRCDVATGEWSSKAPLLTPREGHGVVVVDDVVYVIGGGNEFYKPLNSVETYNENTDSWSFSAKLKDTRRRVTACVVDGCVYVVGGESKKGKAMADVEVLNVRAHKRKAATGSPKTLKWKSVPSMKQARRGAAVCASGAFIYAVGGEDNSGAGR
jgi:hypothetical protein